MYKSNMAENPEKQAAWKCRLDQYPHMILNPNRPLQDLTFPFLCTRVYGLVEFAMYQGVDPGRRLMSLPFPWKNPIYAPTMHKNRFGLIYIEHLNLFLNLLLVETLYNPVAWWNNLLYCQNVCLTDKEKRQGTDIYK